MIMNEDRNGFVPIVKDERVLPHHNGRCERAIAHEKQHLEERIGRSHIEVVEHHQLRKVAKVEQKVVELERVVRNVAIEEHRHNHRSPCDSKPLGMNKNQIESERQLDGFVKTYFFKHQQQNNNKTKQKKTKKYMRKLKLNITKNLFITKCKIVIILLDKLQQQS